MQRAYVFRRGIEATPENRDRALLVLVDEYQREYGDQIRCPYEPCFQELKPIRPENARHHWRHPSASESDYCPYRVEGSGSGSANWLPHMAALDDVLLRVKDRLAQTGTECRLGTAGGHRAGLIGDWGAILPIHRDNLRARAESFEVDDRRVIPVVALADLKALNEHKLAPYLRQIVERQPVPVIRPAMEGPSAPWSLLTDPDQIGPEQIEDMIVGAIPIPINARGLFGAPSADASFPWPPPGLMPIWVWTDHKDGLDAVKEGLERSERLGTKVLRLLAKRLLVDGGSVHRALFAQSREEARDFFLVAERTFPRVEQIVQPTELADVGGDTVLAEVLGTNHLVLDCFRDLKTQGQHEQKKQTELAAVRAQLDEQLARHRKESDDRRQLEEQLGRLEKAREEIASELDAERKERREKEERLFQELALAQRRTGWALTVAVGVILALAAALWLVSC